MPNLSSKLRAKGLKTDVKVRKGPLWQGPEADGPLGGVTFSMLSRWLSCRERARVHFVEGVRPTDRFNHRLEYGQMFHLCEDRHAADRPWESALSDYATSLIAKYPMQRDDVMHWYRVCHTQFPHYVEHWRRHREEYKVTSVLQEQVFDVPYRLPSGRTVRLRGKWDGVSVLKGKGADGVWLDEAKTKGDVDESAIRRQLKMDLQTMLYLVVLGESICPTCKGHWTKEKAKFLDESHDTCPNCVGNIVNPFVKSSEWKPRKGFPDTTIRGVRYNVVRRPLSGGKGTIKQLKTETRDEYYARLGKYIEDEPGNYFYRWTSEVTPADVRRFRETCLDPMLEAVCNWYGTVTHRRVPMQCLAYGHNWTHPFGVTNNIDEYGHSDVDEYLSTGSMVGLRRVDSLFDELKEAV